MNMVHRWVDDAFSLNINFKYHMGIIMYLEMLSVIGIFKKYIILIQFYLIRNNESR